MAGDSWRLDGGKGRQSLNWSRENALSSTVIRGPFGNNDPQFPGVSSSHSEPRLSMTLNKKQKKQIEAARKKQSHLRQQLAGAKKQMDDPLEVERLKKELAQVDAEIEKIQKDG
jgi:hypothetical protein